MNNGSLSEALHEDKVKFMTSHQCFSNGICDNVKIIVGKTRCKYSNIKL